MPPNFFLRQALGPVEAPDAPEVIDPRTDQHVMMDSVNAISAPNPSMPTQAHPARVARAGLRHVLSQMLGNFSYGAGQAMMKEAGLETDAERAVRLARDEFNTAQIQRMNSETQQTNLQNQMTQRRMDAMQHFADPFALFGELSPEEQAIKSASMQALAQTGDINHVLQSVNAIATARRMREPKTPEAQAFDYLVSQGRSPAEALQLAKEAGNQSELTQHTRNYLAANNLPDTPQNRLRAENDYIQRTKIAPAQIRVEGFGNIRQNPVFDRKTGTTIYVNSNDLNKLNAAEPGRYGPPQYDPQAQGLKNLGTSFASGPQATNIQSFRTFLGHANDLSEAVNEVRTSGQPWINRPLNELRKETGDPLIAAYVAKIEPVQKEFATFLLGNHALQQDDRERMQEILSEKLSPAQMQAVLKSLVGTAALRLKSINQTYKNTAGKDYPGLLDDSSREIFNRFGYGNFDFTGSNVPKAVRDRMPTPGGVQVTAPNGQVYTFPTQLQADQFKKAAGIQ